MFLKTLKHFTILKLKELCTLLIWVGIVLGIGVLLLAPGQIILRNPEHFKFLGSLAKVDEKHPILQLWFLGTVESLLFWLCAMFIVVLGFGIVSLIQGETRGYDYKRRFKQWCFDMHKELIACGIFLLFGFGFVFFSGLFHSVVIHPWGIGKKVLGIVSISVACGVGLSIVGYIACEVINGVYRFFRNNWRCAKVLAEKETLCK